MRRFYNRLIATLSAQPGTVIRGVTHSPITGNNGTREFFLHVVFGAGETGDLSIAVDAAVTRAITLQPYRK